MSVDFYIDWNESAYKTETLSFENSADVDKFWVRLVSGAVANSHKIRMYHTESGMLPKIHAIMPWFKPVGRVDTE